MQLPQPMLQVLDSFMMALHLGVIAINLFAWWPRQTRRLHRVMLGLTLFSWLVCGAFYGWGYCFLTDWHWRLKRAAGETSLPHSFPQYVLRSLGLELPPLLIDSITASLLISVVLISAWQIYCERRRQSSVDKNTGI